MLWVRGDADGCAEIQQVMGRQRKWVHSTCG